MCSCQHFIHVTCHQVKVMIMVTVLVSASLLRQVGSAPVVIKHKSSWDVWHRLCVLTGKGHALDLGKRTAESAPPALTMTLTDEERLKRVRDTVLEAKRAASVIKKLMAAERLVDSALIAKLEEPTLTVRGMPQIEDVGRSEETGDFAAAEMIHEAFWNVAIATAFVKDSRQSEISYEHGRYSRRYGSLHEKMCAGMFELRSYLVARSYDVDERDLLSQVEAVDLIDASEQTIRHIQHYLVMRDIDKILFSTAKIATTAYLAAQR